MRAISLCGIGVCNKARKDRIGSEFSYNRRVTGAKATGGYARAFGYGQSQGNAQANGVRVAE
ncbi:MAG: hypothetical protein ACRCUK_13905 [Plesiomonas shigelloides]